jgi:hypothetical protein
MKKLLVLLGAVFAAAAGVNGPGVMPDTVPVIEGIPFHAAAVIAFMEKEVMPPRGYSPAGAAVAYI